MISNYLTEIISRAEWKKKGYYRQETTAEIDFKTYKTTLPQLKQVMKDLNNGIFKSTLVFDLNNTTSIKITVVDKKLIEILKSLDYEVSNESYLLGFVQKKDKTILVTDVLNSLDNKNIESMQAAYEKKPNENIKKQIDALTEYNTSIKKNKKRIAGYKIADQKKYKIVISMQPRLIASQSTEVGWTSCMNLDDGMNRRYVGSGIGEGVLVAYLVKTGDEQTLESPTARLLLKPFKSKDNIVFDVDRIYGTANNQFEQRVINILKNKKRYLHAPINDLKFGVYTLPDKVYDDGLSTKKVFAYGENSPERKIIDALNTGNMPKNKIIEEIIKNHDDEFKKYILKVFDHSFTTNDQFKISKTFKGINFDFLNLNPRNYIKFIVENKKEELENKNTFFRIYNNFNHNTEKYFIDLLIENDYKFSFEIIKEIVETEESHIKYFWHLLNSKEIYDIITDSNDLIVEHWPKNINKLDFLKEITTLPDFDSDILNDMKLNDAQKRIIIKDLVTKKRRSVYKKYLNYVYYNFDNVMTEKQTSVLDELL